MPTVTDVRARYAAMERFWLQHIGLPYRSDQCRKYNCCPSRCGADCSGSQQCAYAAGGMVIPDVTSTIAAFGMAHGTIVAGPNPNDARWPHLLPGDMLVRSTNGDPFNSGGPVGHIEQVKAYGAPGRVWTYGSASRHGTQLYDRPWSMWTGTDGSGVRSVAVRHPMMIADGTWNIPGAPAPEKKKDHDMNRLIIGKGEGATAAIVMTNGPDVRVMNSPAEVTAYINGGWTDGVGVIPWPAPIVNDLIADAKARQGGPPA